jgi:hypothetical protein
MIRERLYGRRVVISPGRLIHEECQLFLIVLM